MQDTHTRTGLSRREVLRRGAALSAAVAVSGPLVQALGQMPAFAQASPPPDGEPVTPSHFQLLVTFASDPTKRGIKYDAGEGWNGLQKQGNRCWDPDEHGFEAATRDQVAYLNANASVVATARGYEVTLPSIVSVVETATFDGGNCFYMGQDTGPYWSGSTVVFPKPGSGQGGGGGAGNG